MKKYLLLLLLAIFVLSCSKKVEIKGKITNASPLERIEIIEASGVGTLPLVNLGLNSKGEFQGEFEAPKEGMYVVIFGGNSTMIYLEGGQKLNLNGDAVSFPQLYTISGDAKANNDFLKEAQKAFETYASKIQMEGLLTKNEAQFITEFNKIKDEVIALIEKNGEKYKASSSAIKYKKNESLARLIGLLDAYEQQHTMLAGKKEYKPSEEFKKMKKNLVDADQMIKDFPMYREYELNKLNPDFQTFAAKLPQNTKVQPMISEVFADFLKTKKELSQTAKDYFYAYVLAQSDMNFTNAAKYDKITQLIDENISDSKIKKDLKQLQQVLMGEKKGAAPQLKIVSADGKSQALSDLTGKPTLVTFYASWNPNISINTTPVLKEVTEFYKSKMNYVYVNLDDTKEQFVKTKDALLKGFSGTHFWVEGGISSTEAKKFGLYGFKMPSYLILDKDGKVYDRPFFNLGDPEFVTAMDKLTGLKAPQTTPEPMPQAEITTGHRH